MASQRDRSDTHISRFTHGFTAIQQRQYKTPACRFKFPRTLDAQEGNTTQKLKCDQNHTQRKKKQHSKKNIKLNNNKKVQTKVNQNTRTHKNRFLATKVCGAQNSLSETVMQVESEDRKPDRCAQCQGKQATRGLCSDDSDIYAPKSTEKQPSTSYF